MKFFLRLIVVAFTVIASVAHAQQIELISKKDAHAVFSMTRARWNSNVLDTVAAGKAKAIGKPANGLGMATTTSEAYMIVRPDYEKGENRPSFVQVTIAYLDPKVSSVLRGAVLQSAIETAQNQLAPDFDLSGFPEQVQGKLVIHFFIRPRG